MTWKEFLEDVLNKCNLPTSRPVLMSYLLNKGGEQTNAQVSEKTFSNFNRHAERLFDAG